MNRRCCLVFLTLFVSVLGFCFHPAVAVDRPGALSGPGEVAAAAQPLDQTFSPAASRARVAADYGRLPLYFIANRGQVDQRVKYYLQGRGQTTFFTPGEIVLTLRQPEMPGAGNDNLPGPADPARMMNPGTAAFESGPAADFREPENVPRTYSVVRIKPVGLQEGVKISALEKTGHRVNYFLGNDPQKWRTDIPTYRAVVYENAYAGIDLKFYGKGQQLEYDVVVQPGADPGQVKFAFQGVKEMQVTPAGDLALVLPDGGRLAQKKPVIYQEVAGRRLPVDGKFRLCQGEAALSCGFTVAAYDRKLPLVIDPGLVYSTYLGGPGGVSGNAIAVDAGGSAYVAGATSSPEFPTTAGAYQETAHYPGYGCSFITKLSPAGNSLVYSTYLGGNIDEGWDTTTTIRGIAVDASGAAYVTGSTYAYYFPIVDGYQKTKGMSADAFFTKLNPTGSALLYSTYLGGRAGDYGRAIAVDANGAAYIAGYTASDDFPTQNAYQGTLAGDPGGSRRDAFVTKFTKEGDALVFSTYLGGTSPFGDSAFGIALDNQGAAYVTGTTQSDDFPTYQAYQDTYAGNVDAFVTKFSAVGALVYSTYLGGGGQEIGYSAEEGPGIAVDAGGAAYVTGATNSQAHYAFPTRNPYQANFGGGAFDVFVTKLTPAGDDLVYSTYLGGNLQEAGCGITVDAGGAAYVTGFTSSDNFPVCQAFQGTLKGAQDAFVAKLAPAGNALAYSTYLGGGGSPGYNVDYGSSIAIDAGGAAYVTGYTTSDSFPTKNPFQGTASYGGDAFITKLEPGGAPAPGGGIQGMIPLLLLGN